MVHECLVGFRKCDRYVAHSKIDDALRNFPRGELRNWHSSVIQSAPDAFSGVIRTKSKEVMDALPEAKWRTLAIPNRGELSVSYVEVAPKKTNHFTRYRDPVFATEYVRARLQEAGAFEEFTHEYLWATQIEIRKSACPYRAPSAWFRVTGRVKDTAAFERLVLQGIGGSHSFGVGLLNPSESAIHHLAKSVAGTQSGMSFE